MLVIMAAVYDLNFNQNSNILNGYSDLD
jgi:hypothetical protein